MFLKDIMKGKCDAFSVPKSRNKLCLVYLQYKLHQHRFGI